MTSMFDVHAAQIDVMFQTPTFDVDVTNVDVRQLLLEKVKLEGQLEMVEAEARTALRERAELQTQVHAYLTHTHTHTHTEAEG